MCRGGVAAASKQSSKHRKYDSLCEQIGSEFRAGVAERFGACCDDMQGLIRMVAGDGESLHFLHRTQLPDLKVAENPPRGK